MIIKVCGLREAENIRAVEEAGADAFGFIFYPRSPRYVDKLPAYLPGGLRVGVFVEPSLGEVEGRVGEWNLGAVQLHGEVNPKLGEQLRAEGLRVWRAVAVSDDLAWATGEWAGACDLFVFDTPCAGFGGSGRGWDWGLLEDYMGGTPFLLSGGLGPGSLGALGEFQHPAWAGVDLNSGFETRPGVKDAGKLAAFIAALRRQERESGATDAKGVAENAT